MEPTHRTVETNGIHMHIAEAGEGPLVVLLHGFPESWYSWRHQLRALADAGYHAVAPDQRGYGRTDRPDAPATYTQLHLVADVVGLLAALGGERAVVVGHDWGAPVAWNTALLRPDLVRGVAGLSVPYMPRGDADVLTTLEQMLGPNNYQAYFQESGVAEADLERDVRSTVLQSLYQGSGDNPVPFDLSGATGSHFADPGVAAPDVLPAWLTEADIDYFTAEFERTGFRGGLNWYRTSRQNWELLAPWHQAPLQAPALYVGGDRDVVVQWPGIRDYIGVMQMFVPNLTKAVILEGCGHWTQQERAAEVNDLLLEFLAGLGS